MILAPTKAHQPHKGWWWAGGVKNAAPTNT